jgi:HSP20 family molecular chaperone IbpA
MTYRDPRWVWAEALELLREAGQIQRRFFQLGAAEAPAWEPAVDLLETSEGLSVEIALPGVAPDVLEVSLESGSVVVRGERAFPAKQQRAVIYRLEIPYGRFERRIPLPGGRYQLADRRLENGCLVLALRRLG